MSFDRSRVARRFAVAMAAICVVLPAGTASAGRLIATGHDADHHCGRATNDPKDWPPHAQCGFFKTAVDYVRGGAPDPSKPVLVLDRGALDVVTSLDRIYGANALPRVVKDPRRELAGAPITTDLYSAIIIASSGGDPEDPTPQDLNERDSAPDSAAINARANDIQAFFNAGGGIFVNSGNKWGDGPNDPYYAFLPIEVQSSNVNYPFELTDLGRSLGFTDNDVKCCPTHNTFDPPSPQSALKAIDVDAKQKVVSLTADTGRFEDLGDPQVTPQTTQQAGKDLPSSGSCVRQRSLKLRIRRPRGYRFSRATIYVNNRRVKRVSARKLRKPVKVSLKHPRWDTLTRVRVRIVVVTTGKRKITIRRTYRICS